MMLTALSAQGLPCRAETGRIEGIKLPLNSQWGKPVQIQYDETTQSGDWRYIRRDATLIVTRTPCAECKEFSQADVDAHRTQKGPSAVVLLNHKGLPALLRLLPDTNGENLRIFQLQADGFRYDIRMGTDSQAPQAFAFQMEMEFLQLINAFNPQKQLSKYSR